MGVLISWASEELEAVLAKLSAQQAAGVQRIIEAELAGRSLSSLLDCSGQICTSTTYYGHKSKNGRDRPGWNAKPEFRQALTLARRDYRAWMLEHGTSEALQVLTSTAPSAARALKHQVEGDADAAAALCRLLESERVEDRLNAANGLLSVGLPAVVPAVIQALEAEKDESVRAALITVLGRIAGYTDADRRLAAAAVLDRADVKTAAKQAREIDQDELDREIERRLAQLASGSEAALADALASAGGDPG
ncbi:MAG: hypothetical protein BWY63_02655 [Chloroflexi bacterium ADurb.Bin360]|nr:MAG: hypothetical protein BWY63_02655 [Chloroflexi bacterium ADurb.Bin360]